MINPKRYSPLIRGNINGPVWFQRRPVGGSLLFSNTKEEIRVPLRKRTCQSTSAQLKQKHVQKIKNYCVFNWKMDTLRRGMEFTKRQAPGPLTPTQFNQLLLNGFLKVFWHLQCQIIQKQAWDCSGDNRRFANNVSEYTRNTGVHHQLRARIRYQVSGKFVHFPQSCGVFYPFEPLLTFPHNSLVHVSILLFVLHVVVFVLVVQKRYFDNSRDVLLCALRVGARSAAFGASVRFFRWKNSPVPKVGGGAALLLLRHHLLLEVSFLEDKNGFRREAEGELDALLPFLFAAELSARVHGAGSPDASGFLSFRHRQPGAFSLGLMCGTHHLSWAFSHLLLGSSP